jgi:formylmethanofuran dehydrogenase subunit E
MTRTTISPEVIEQTIKFHGHSCPGLTLGIRASEWALAEFGRAVDEDIVAVAETDMCAVDAVQFLTGCTFGKGNLIYVDYGKNAFTFYRRSDGKAIRIVGKSKVLGDQDDEFVELRKKMIKEDLDPDEKKRLKEVTAVRTKRIMDARLEEILEEKPAQGLIPRKARILESLICQNCGEATMESRTRRLFNKALCIPCFEAMEKRF